MSRIALATVVCVAAAAVPAAALADNPQLKPNAADQAAAKRAVVQLSDFRAGSGWKGGPTKGSSSGSPKCSFDPKESDLVQTADALSSFTYKLPLLQIYSEATMYQTAHMAQLSWQRARPGLLGFLRCLIRTSLPSNAKVVSVTPMSFPRFGSFVSAYRTIFDVIAGSTKLPMIIDVEFFGTGRTIFSLMQFSPYDGADAVKAGETRLASAMSARADNFAA